MIEYLVAKVGSSYLRSLEIDFTEPLKQIRISKENLRKAKEAESTAAAARLKGTKSARISNQESTTLQLGRESLPQISNAEVISLIRHSVQRWGNTLVSVNFVNKDTFWLPLDVFESLLLCPDMEDLGITGMGIDFMDTALHRLKDSKLQTLHLPVHPKVPGISLARFRYIAEACPHLKSFRCRVKHLSNIPVSFPMSHQLQVLSVSNEHAHPEQKRLLDIARYLDSIFPNITSIETHEGSGNNAEQWRFISDLMKLCQAVRTDDEHRRLKSGGVESVLP